MNLTIPPETTAEERKRILDESFAALRSVREERDRAAKEALEAMPRLAGVMRQKTDQGRVLRRLLYSLWNNNPCANLCDVVVLDWPLRRDLGAVLLGFGYEGRDTRFFYDELKQAIAKAGIWDWFLEAAE